MNDKEMTLKQFTDGLEQQIKNFSTYWKGNHFSTYWKGNQREWEEKNKDMGIWPSKLPLAEWQEQFLAYCSNVPAHYSNE